MCTTCSECVTDVYVGVKTHLCNVHTLPCTRAQNTCSKVHVTWVRTRAQDTVRHAKAPSPGPFICTYVCTCMRMHTRAHVRVHGRTRICMYTRTCTPAHMYAYTSTHKRMWMYACTHASTPGKTAPQQQGEELIQTPDASHIYPIQRNQPHLASQMLGIVPTS